VGSMVSGMGCLVALFNCLGLKIWFIDQEVDGYGWWEMICGSGAD